MLRLSGDVRAKTDDLSRRWMAAYQAKDTAALGATYTTNGKALPAGTDSSPDAPNLSALSLTAASRPVLVAAQALPL